MTSPDGITWTSRTSAANSEWYGVTYGNNTFVAVAQSGTGGRVMTSSTAVLPIELLSFTGKFLLNDNKGSNLLTWQTASEVNNKGFQVERAPQPPQGASLTWETLGFVDAKGKAATYEFTDESPLRGLGVYRLRQMDNDGKETLSKVISIATTDKGKGLKVYPNPVSNTLTVENTEGVLLKCSTS
jgi:trimeric autotransporter adhesin